ncbi:LysR substrate-binding domain-containing protein [Streptomyces hygroscopicus]|uniref:LysR substrate-binding domain-containing protein n=1 Tax=Streptomyces hygroscopicus TaxID=1912 RepID=UPI002AD50A82|nr:LysR substrate-binding domain-containing protein [Streptomyces hygroscopicus]
MLRRGELDLQVGEVPVAGPGIAAGPVLLREPRALMVPADHPLARRDSVSLEDLAGVPMIIPGGNVPKALLDIHVPTRTPMGRHIPRGPSCTFWPEVTSLVAAGLGVSVVAARAARHHDRPGIAFVPFRDGPTLDYGVLWRTAGQAPSVPLAFVDFLRDLSHTTETTSSSVGSSCARRWAQTSSSVDARRSGHSLSAVLSGGVTAVPGPAAPAHGTPPGIRTDRGPAGVLPRAVCVLSEDPGDPS